jgi:hypothetical protein
MMGTEAHANRRKDGDRNTYEQTKGWGQKHIRKSKGVGTEAHTNKTKRLGQKGDRRTNGKTNPCSLKTIDMYIIKKKRERKEKLMQ